jgi:hypothetical protein
LSNDRKNQKDFLPACRLLWSGLLVLALFLTPLSFSGNAVASEHHSHTSMNFDGDTGNDGHTDHSHKVIHCDSSSCSPSNIAGSKSSAHRLASSLAQGLVGDDPLLRSLYLDGDPPVPRRDFA